MHIVSKSQYLLREAFEWGHLARFTFANGDVVDGRVTRADESGFFRIDSPEFVVYNSAQLVSVGFLREESN